MSLNFPPSANTGDIYTSGNASYEFTGTKWKPVNRVDYTIQASDIVAANNELVIDFDTDGVQRLTLSEEATVTFANSPAEGEYKKVLLDLTANTDSTFETIEPWSIINPTYENEKTTVDVQSPAPSSVHFSADGAKMFILDSGNKSVFEYNLTTPWVVSSATYSGFSYSAGSSFNAGISSLSFKPDGTAMYISGIFNTGSGFIRWIRSYNLTTPWNLSGGVGSLSQDLRFDDGNIGGFDFKPDGTKIYVIGTTGNTVYEYNLSIPWDISSNTQASTYSFNQGDVININFKPDGTKFYVAVNVDSKIYEYSLTNPWSIESSSSAYSTILNSFSAQETALSDFFFKSDGTKIYIVGTTNDTVYEYMLGVGMASSLQWPSDIEWEDGTPPTLPALTETALIELEARTDYLGTNYIGRLVGRNF